MGRRGPARTPTIQLARRGSWLAKKRANEVQPPSGLPDAPAWLCESAVPLYNHLRENPGVQAVCTSADAETLARLADAYDSLNKCKTAQGIWKAFMGPNGAACIHPLQKLWLEASTLAGKIERDLGLSPSARAGLVDGHATRQVDSCFAM